MTVTEYIEGKRWKYRLVKSKRGDELLLDHCPFCGKKDHFYINSQSGAYYCQAGTCGERGSLYTLMKHMGDILPIHGFEDIKPAGAIDEVSEEELSSQVEEAHHRLLNDKKGLRWCSNRMWTMQAIDHFKLGISEEGGKTWLWYPYTCRGKITNVKKRLLYQEKSFMRLRGGSSDLFNQELLSSGQTGEVILCEGESDTIALYSLGFQNVLGISIGAKGLNPEWIDLLDKINKIYVCFDTDAAGEEGALQFAKRVGLEKCYHVKLPGKYKDVNEFTIAGGSATSFMTILQSSKPFDVEGVRSALTVVQDMIVRQSIGVQEQPGFSYPWPMVDKVAGRMCPGDLITIAGMPGVGKTNFALYIAYILASVREIPAMVFELEFPPEKLIYRLLAMHGKKNMDPLTMPSVAELKDFHESFKDIPFYFAYRHRPPDWATIEGTVKESVRRYGIKVLVFDNIHYLVRSTKDQTREISLVSQQFKTLAKELEIPILMVARPRKTRGPIDSQDIKDSADIEGDSDTIILLNRRKNSTGETGIGIGTYASDTAVNVDKARWGPGGGVMLHAIDAQARFVDTMDEKKDEEEPVPF